MRTSLAGVVLSMLIAPAMGCAAGSAQLQRASAPDARAACTSSAAVCSPQWLGARLARGDVTTWRDYYTSVMDEAFRRNSSVIWINPPTPIANVARADGSLPSGIAH
jgi:hypothetical protein